MRDQAPRTPGAEGARGHLPLPLGFWGRGGLEGEGPVQRRAVDGQPGPGPGGPDRGPGLPTSCRQESSDSLSPFRPSWIGWPRHLIELSVDPIASVGWQL